MARNAAARLEGLRGRGADGRVRSAKVVDVKPEIGKVLVEQRGEEKEGVQ